MAYQVNFYCQCGQTVETEFQTQFAADEYRRILGELHAGPGHAQITRADWRKQFGLPAKRIRKD